MYCSCRKGSNPLRWGGLPVKGVRHVILRHYRRGTELKCRSGLLEWLSNLLKALLPYHGPVLTQTGRYDNINFTTYHIYHISVNGRSRQIESPCFMMSRDYLGPLRRRL